MERTEKNGRYMIKILPAEGCNPEYAPESKAQAGTEADGFCLVCLEDGKPKCEQISGATVMQIAEWLAYTGTEMVSVFRQAVAIADGLSKAKEIREKYEAINVSKNLGVFLDMLRNNGAGKE